MTLIDEQRAWSSGWLGPLALSVPLLLGASLLEQSTPEPALPPEETYRTPFSENILGNSQDWRQSSAQRELEWRKPKDSDSDWRSTPSDTMQGPQRPGHIEVLPKYEHEKGIAYDFTKEKSKDEINYLQFRF